MPAVHDEAARAHRHQLLERGLDPILGFHRVESDALRDLAAGGNANEFADRSLIGRLGKMHGNVPAPVGPLERGDCGLAHKKALVQQIDHVLRGLLVADGKGRAVGDGGEGGGHQRTVKAKGEVESVMKEPRSCSQRYTPNYPDYSQLIALICTGLSTTSLRA